MGQSTLVILYFQHTHQTKIQSVFYGILQSFSNLYGTYLQGAS